MTLVHDKATPTSLHRAQFLVTGLWFLKTAAWAWSDLAALPLSLFQPVGLHRWLPDACWPTLLDGSVLESLRFSVLGLLLLAWSRRARPLAFLGAGVLLLHHQALIHGFGFVNHQELVLLYALFVFGLFGLGGRPWEERAAGLPIVTILLVLCLTYALAGVYRIVRHPELLTDAGTMMGWVLLNSARPLHYGWTIGLGLPWGPWLNWLMQLGFIGITVLEILAPLALVSRRFRVVFLLVLPIPFHVTCLVLMNIFFWENALLMLLFFDLARARWDRRRRDGPSACGP